MREQILSLSKECFSARSRKRHRGKGTWPYRYEHLGFSTAGQLGENMEASQKSLQSREAEAPEVWVLLEMRLSGSSSSSSPLSSGMASSGMACIWTPGAWGSILRFSWTRCHDLCVLNVDFKLFLHSLLSSSSKASFIPLLFLP